MSYTILYCITIVYYSILYCLIFLSCTKSHTNTHTHTPVLSCPVYPLSRNSHATPQGGAKVTVLIVHPSDTCVQQDHLGCETISYTSGIVLVLSAHLLASVSQQWTYAEPYLRTSLFFAHFTSNWSVSGWWVCIRLLCGHFFDALLVCGMPACSGDSGFFIPSVIWNSP